LYNIPHVTLVCVRVNKELELELELYFAHSETYLTIKTCFWCL